MFAVIVGRRFDLGTSPDSLYSRAFDVLSSLAPPWGLRGVAKKHLPPVKTNHSTGVSYTRDVGRPVKVYVLAFQNRDHTKPSPDIAMYDDSLIVEIRPKQLTSERYNALLREALPTYIDAMHPYRIALDESTIGVDDARIQLPNGASIPRPEYVEPRVGVHWIWPANFWDRELCRRAFGLTPEEVVERLSDHVAETRILNDGVLVIDSFNIPSDEAIRQIDARLRPLLLAR